jgi:hypothetical protein
MLVRTRILCYGLIIDQEQMIRPVQTQACTLDWSAMQKKKARLTGLWSANCRREQNADAWTSPVEPPACWLLVVTDRVVTCLQSISEITLSALAQNSEPATVEVSSENKMTVEVSSLYHGLMLDNPITLQSVTGPLSIASSQSYARSPAQEHRSI